jgi:hypothetical protein
MSMKCDNDIIEDRPGDLPVCRAVPEPTEPPRAPCLLAMPKENFSSHVFEIDGRWDHL